MQLKVSYSEALDHFLRPVRFLKMAELDVAKFPAGNWIAHQLRLVNDDSKKLFPSTAGSKRSYRKYDSLYMVDFEDFPDGALTTRMMDKLNVGICCGGVKSHFGLYTSRYRGYVYFDLIILY